MHLKTILRLFLMSKPYIIKFKQTRLERLQKLQIIYNVSLELSSLKTNFKWLRSGALECKGLICVAGPVGCIDLPNQNKRVRFVARLISSTFTLTQRWSTFGSHESGSVLIGSLPSSKYRTVHLGEPEWLREGQMLPNLIL
ncbi:hypothetical protein GQX74_009446 [Glossina fuscipes]|nr:hypothetical protein GQX74_009446 [Glossina fuscipes]